MHDIGMNEKTSIGVIVTYLLAAVIGAIVGGAVVYALIKGSKQETTQPIARQTAEQAEGYASRALPDHSKYIE